MAKIAPTKTNLIRTKQELQFARQGHELLDQKRNILVIELLNLVDQAVDFDSRVREALSEAHSSLQKAVLEAGKITLVHVSGADNMKAEINLSRRKVMGVPLPVVDTDFQANPPYYSPLGTSSWTDVSLGAFQKALEMMGRLAELKVSIMRLAKEVKKTIRKVNALEKIAIPDLEESVDFIRNRLEENERDMFTLMKIVKERLEKKKERGV
ncbi:MAG: V-type ATP synthase subunit D [bacterium]